MNLEILRTLPASLGSPVIFDGNGTSTIFFTLFFSEQKELNMVCSFHGLYIRLWRVVVFSVARMVLFPPVGIFPKIGWCSSSWFGVPLMGFVLFVPYRVVCPHGAVFCSRLLFSLPECATMVLSFVH